MCVGLVKPKPGVFHNMVKYLLILTTSVEIVILGVTFSKSKEGIYRDIFVNYLFIFFINYSFFKRTAWLTGRDALAARPCVLSAH